jgi:uncharacterized membrane protein
MSSQPLSNGRKANIIREDDSQKPLVKQNFVVIAIAGAMIVLGFLLMLGGASTTEQFNPDIFSTRRIVVGPAITFLGFVGVAIGIILKPKARK